MSNLQGGANPKGDDKDLKADPKAGPTGSDDNTKGLKGITQEELNKILAEREIENQKEIDRRVSEAVKKRDLENQKKLEEEKLTDAQKLAVLEKQLRVERNERIATTRLAENGLDLILKDFISLDKEEDPSEQVIKLSKAINAIVEKKVEIKTEEIKKGFASAGGGGRQQSNPPTGSGSDMQSVIGRATGAQ